MQNKRILGSAYESKAAIHLENMGYKIIEKNFRCRIGEIDLIAKCENYLVFAEVKFRANNSCGTPQEAVDYHKQRVICKVADYYCLTHGYGETTPCRFDVVAILGEQIEVIPNAFMYVR